MTLGIGDKIVSLDGTHGTIKTEDQGNAGYYWVKWEQLRDWQYDYHNTDAKPNYWTWERVADYKEVAQ